MWADLARLPELLTSGYFLHELLPFFLYVIAAVTVLVGGLRVRGWFE